MRSFGLHSDDCSLKPHGTDGFLITNNCYDSVAGKAARVSTVSIADVPDAKGTLAANSIENQPGLVLLQSQGACFEDSNPPIQ